MMLARLVKKEVGTGNRYTQKSKPQEHLSTADTFSVTLDDRAESHILMLMK